MKKVLFKRFNSFIIAFLLVLTMPIATVEKTVIAETSNELIKLDNFELENIPEEIKSALNVNFKKVTSIINHNAFDNVISLKNEDGTITQKIFDKPVKYEKDGEMQFINNTIEEIKIPSIFTKYKYKNTDNFFETYFSKDLEDGIRVKSEEMDYSVEIIPVTDSDATATTRDNVNELSNNNNVVEYNNAFDEFSRLYYETTPTGLKESLILDKYNGQEKYDYIIETDLVPKNTSGEFIEFRKETSKKTVAKIDKTFIIDSEYDKEVGNKNHITYNNNYSIKEISKGKYLLTVNVDTDFLTAKSTVYPVNIDPSFEFISPLKTEKNVYVLKTTSVYKGDKEYKGNKDKWNRVGKTSDQGIGLCYVKIHLPDQARIIDANNITTAYFETYEGSGNTSSIKINLFDTQTPNWTLANIDYNTRPALASEPTSSITIKKSGWKKFNITPLAKNWMKKLLNEGGFACDRGFALKADDNTVATRHFSSHNNSNYNISLTINYDEVAIETGQYYLQNVHSGLMLDLSSDDNTSAIQYGIHGKNNQKWNIQIDGGGYKIQSVKKSGNYLVKDETTYNSNSAVRKAIVNNTGFERLYIIKNGDETYRIFKVAEDELAPQNATWDCLEVYNNSVDEWGQVTWQPYKGNPNQKWILVKVSDITIYRNVNAINLPYDRDAAITYAIDNAEFEDETYDTPDFLKTGSANCTNFVSACLFKGGIEPLYGDGRTEDNAWYYSTLLGEYYSSYTWGGAENFARHFGHNGKGEGNQRCYMTFKFDNKEIAKKYFNFIVRISNDGDIVQYFDSTEVWHSMIIVDIDKTNNSIIHAQHSNNAIYYLKDRLNELSQADGMLLHLIKKGA